MIFIPVYLVIIPIFASLVIYIFKNKHMNYLALLAQAVVTVLAIVYYQHFSGNFEATMFVFGGWDDRIGISMSNDALSLSFVFLTVFTWWMVLLYTFDKGNTNHNFIFFLLFLEGVFFGILMTNDLFNMFVFLELAAILVTILIAFNKAGNSFRAGIYYLLVNTAGVLTFLIGIILIYFTFGTININVITNLMPLYGDELIIKFAYVLLMSGIAVKSALFPVFTWLPHAHGVAQSAISALLSGLIVKGGLYLFIRINQMYAAANYDYYAFFFVLGALTAIVGVMFALSQKDMKQILAYHTVSQIGIMMMGLSSQDVNVYYGGVLHIFNHALFKSLLFLGAGVIIKVYRTKKVNEIRGVFKTMPWVSIFMIVGMLSITGAPLFNGFISKSIIKYGIQDSGIKYWTLFIINIGTATSFIKMSQIFFGPQSLSYPMQRKLQNFALMSIAFGCIILGNFYIPINQGFFGIDLSYIHIFEFAKFFDYFLTLAIGYLFYYFIISKDKPPIPNIRNFSISFEASNIIFIALIVVMTIYFVLL